MPAVKLDEWLPICLTERIILIKAQFAPKYYASLGGSSVSILLITVNIDIGN